MRDSFTDLKIIKARHKGESPYSVSSEPAPRQVRAIPSTKRPSLGRVQRRTSSQNHPKNASTGSQGTSRTITPYSEDIPPMEEEAVGDMRWVKFVTLVDRKGGQYRQRSSAPAAYGGFSDIWQCDGIFSGGGSVVVGCIPLSGAA